LTDSYSAWQRQPYNVLMPQWLRKLDPERQREAEAIIEECRSWALSTEEADREATEQAIATSHGMHGLAAPVFVWADSPLSGELAHALLKAGKAFSPAEVGILRVVGLSGDGHQRVGPGVAAATREARRGRPGRVDPRRGGIVYPSAAHRAWDRVRADAARAAVGLFAGFPATGGGGADLRVPHRRPVSPAAERWLGQRSSLHSMTGLDSSSKFSAMLMSATTVAGTWSTSAVRTVWSARNGSPVACTRSTLSSSPPSVDIRGQACSRDLHGHAPTGRRPIKAHGHGENPADMDRKVIAPQGFSLVRYSTCHRCNGFTSGWMPRPLTLVRESP
jgi:hypothetical protein